MTDPRQMNCPHDGDGWCLACVEQHDQKLRKEVKRLGRELFDAEIIAAYLGEAISEGVACRLTGLDPVALRQRIGEYNLAAKCLWAGFREQNPPSA